MKNTSENIDQSTFTDGNKKMAIKTGKSRWQLRLGVICALTTLAACQSTNELSPIEPVSHTLRHPIQVTNDVVTMQVRGGRRKFGLTSVQRQKIASFVSAYRNTGTGPLKIKSPSAVAHDVLAANAVAEVRRIAEQHSIANSRIRMVNYYPRNPRVSSPVILSFRRNAAIASPCGAWPESFAVTRRNQPYWALGCATQNNLAAMVANPRDLVEPRASTPSDSQRRDVVFDKYRNGSVTTAERDASESGTVSDVAN